MKLILSDEYICTTVECQNKYFMLCLVGSHQGLSCVNKSHNISQREATGRNNVPTSKQEKFTKCGLAKGGGTTEGAIHNRDEHTKTWIPSTRGKNLPYSFYHGDGIRKDLSMPSNNFNPDVMPTKIFIFVLNWLC